jgi:hypothetical protein
MHNDNTETTTYFRHGRIMFSLPLAVGDTAVRNSDLGATKTKIRKIEIVRSGEPIKGYRGTYTFPNGTAYVLHLSTGSTALFCGDQIRGN